jgi:ribosomal protein L15
MTGLSNLFSRIWDWVVATPANTILCILGVLALFVLWGAVLYVVRRHHDRRLEAERAREVAPPPRDVMRPSVVVVKEEQVVEENATLFMPVPGCISGVVDFVSRERDGIAVLDSVRYEEVNRLLSDADADRLTAVVHRKGEEHGVPEARVYLDDLSDAFADDSYVNLAILKDAHLVRDDARSLVVYARGTLRKSLMIEADVFSLEAVKMISLTGGRAILIRT